MPAVTLTEGPDVVNSGFRTSEPEFFITYYMLGGDDWFTNTSSGYGSHRVYMGDGNDYAKINFCYQAILYGEGGNDLVDINNAVAWTMIVDGGSTIGVGL